jgi:hypothetical protein
MGPDNVEVSWDAKKSQWLVRIVTGEEVIRRYCKAPRDADEETLRVLAQKTVTDEGYDSAPAQMNIQR